MASHDHTELIVILTEKCVNNANPLEKLSAILKKKIDW